MRRAPFAALLVALSAMAAVPAAAAPDPSRDVCGRREDLRARQAARQPDLPCLSVDLGDADRPGSAVLRAPGEPTHSVVMPTDTVAGWRHRSCAGRGAPPTGGAPGGAGRSCRTC